MWFDFDGFGVSTALPEDPSIGLSDELVARLRAMRRSDLRIVLDELYTAEYAVMMAAQDWALTTTREDEAPFVDRELRGEQVLADPPSDSVSIFLGASLHAQVLRLPIRWMSDVFECTTEFIEELIRGKTLAKKKARTRKKSGKSK